MIGPYKTGSYIYASSDYWISNNEILLPGVIAGELDEGSGGVIGYKMGDGSNRFSGLAYMNNNLNAADSLQYITITNNGLENTSLWILVNATYNQSDGFFYRKDPTKYAFATQIQASGTIEGEEGIDPTDQGYIIWKCVPANDGVTAKIGTNINGEWKTFGVWGGWYLGFLFTAYSHLVVGGQGIEIDGSGTEPYVRPMNSPSFAAGLTRQIYQGFVTNLYADISGRDQSNYESWFFGVQSNVAAGSNQADGGDFVVKYVAPNADLVDANFQTLLKVAPDGTLQANGNNVPSGASVIVNNAGSDSISVSYPDGFTPVNTYIAAIKAIDSSGMHQIYPAISLTEYGIYISGLTAYSSVTVIIQKI